MGKSKVTIAQAHWLAPRHGCVLLTRDWTEPEPPVLHLSAPHLAPIDVRGAAPGFFGRHAAHSARPDGRIVFRQEPRHHPQIDFARTPVQVAGPFNRWGVDGPRERWELRPRTLADGSTVWERAFDVAEISPDGGQVAFKFVSSEWHWLKVHSGAPNRVFDPAGNANYEFDPARTGAHVFLFDVEGGRGIDGAVSVSLARPGRSREVLLTPGLSFFDLESRLPLGAHVVRRERRFAPSRGGKEATVFRVFAPRATACAVELREELDDPQPRSFPMRLTEDEVTWEARIPGDLHGWFYHLRVSGPEDGLSTQFDAERRIVDPWALATVGPEGPGIVIDRSELPRAVAPGPVFHPPKWHDLVIMEAHLRDLTARAPIECAPDVRDGFLGLAEWIAHPESYVSSLGINALELLPIQQNDAPKRSDYHWGYMTTNYFSPCSHYARAPGAASQIEEFAALVDACHARGIAVILDVVYNHVGEPAHLAFLDKAVYFQFEPDGSHTNWSGCGNTIRPDSAMSRRLVIESLVHLVKTFDVDGFRFDLAELLTVELLGAIETALKAVKPSIVLIAEPWSFRGNIAWRLRSTGIASWNDGFREFVAGYVRGAGNADGLRHFMKGSVDHLAAWPAQSVNYVESHDDRCFLDKITGNPGHDGSYPTPNDIARVHLAGAILLCALGIPMLASGMEFLRSKGGLNNTYLRGDVNALDYARIARFAATSDYFKAWIAFRRSGPGAILRLEHRPGDGHLRLFPATGGSGAALLFNADGALGPGRLLFAVNPHEEDAEFHLDGIDRGGWRELADRRRFPTDALDSGRLDAGAARLRLGPLDCGLWMLGG